MVEGLEVGLVGRFRIAGEGKSGRSGNGLLGWDKSGMDPEIEASESSTATGHMSM